MSAAQTVRHADWKPAWEKATIHETFFGLWTIIHLDTQPLPRTSKILIALELLFHPFSSGESDLITRLSFLANWSDQPRVNICKRFIN